MKSKNNRFVIAFNGEIYNHKFLKRKIDNVKEIKWNGSSDTETFLNLYQFFWNKKNSRTCSRNVWYFTLLDNQEEKLFNKRPIWRKTLILWTGWRIFNKSLACIRY